MNLFTADISFSESGCFQANFEAIGIIHAASTAVLHGGGIPGSCGTVADWGP